MLDAHATRAAQVVTLDGPAGSGKSSVARRLARRLDAGFLDTGAMYRAVAAVCLERGVDPRDAQAVANVARSLEVDFDWRGDPPGLLVEGRDLSRRVRDQDVTAVVSEVAANPAVRRRLVELQRAIARRHARLVSEGRDQGSVVFPDALAKIYLVASAQVRAARRSRQLRDAGQPVDESAILEQIIERDRRDATRDDSPLVRPADAVEVDTSAMTLDEVVDHLEKHVRQALADRHADAQGTIDDV